MKTKGEGMKQDIEALRKIVQVVLNPGPVTYSPVTGVRCRVCKAELRGREMGVYCTRAWSRGSRERYHKCPICGAKFKSVEEA